MSKTLTLSLALAGIFTLTACAPEVGSKRWCEQMMEKPKGDWSINEAGDYARHCLLKPE